MEQSSVRLAGDSNILSISVVRCKDCHSEYEVHLKKKKLILEFVCRVWKQLSSRLKAVQLVTWPESRACHLQENSLKLKDTAVSFSLDEKFCLMLVISVICKFK